MAIAILPEWVKVGTELVERNTRGAYGKTFKIAKVYKTGRFITDETNASGTNNSPQYKVNETFPNERAISVGGSGWRFRDLEVVTPEVEAKIAQYRVYQAAVRKINAEIERLKTLVGDAAQASGNRDTVLAEARKIGRVITVYDWEIRNGKTGEFIGYARTPEKAEAYTRSAHIVRAVYTIEGGETYGFATT